MSDYPKAVLFDNQSVRARIGTLENSLRSYQANAMTPNHRFRVLGFICAYLLIANVSYAAILMPKAPKGGKQIAYAHLKDTGIPDLKVPVKELSLSDPHQCYHVGAKDLANGQLLSKATLFSWRYLVLRGKKGVGEVELNANDANKNAGPLLAFISLGNSRTADGTLIAVRESKKLPQVKAKDYQLRLLRVPGLQFWAVWLQRESGDILVPLDPTHPNFVVNRAYSEAEIIEVLKPIAASRLKASEKNPGLVF